MNTTRPGIDEQSISHGTGEPEQPQRPRRGRRLLVAGAIGTLGAVFKAACLKGEPAYDEGRDGGAKDAGMVDTGNLGAATSNGR